jgi:hypothetical protein
MTTWLVAVGFVLSCLGCSKAEESKDNAQNKVKSAASAVKGETKSLAGKASSLGGDVVAALTPGAQAVRGGIEDIVLRGTQVGEVAEEIGVTLTGAVDSNTVIRPIYQKLDDEAAMAETDKAIGDMPRTEVIDGLTVGFKDLTRIDTKQRVTDSGYLVVWRSDDRLIGFVYRSKSVIDLELLVRETPRLIRLVGTLL